MGVLIFILAAGVVVVWLQSKSKPKPVPVRGPVILGVPVSAHRTYSTGRVFIGYILAIIGFNALGLLSLGLMKVLVDQGSAWGPAIAAFASFAGVALVLWMSFPRAFLDAHAGGKGNLGDVCLAISFICWWLPILGQLAIWATRHN